MKKVLTILIMLLLIAFIPSQVYANDYGDGSNNTVRGGYGNGMYVTTNDGTPEWKSFGGSNLKGGNVYVSSSFMNDWGSRGFFTYLGSPGTLYADYNRNGGGGGNRETGEWTVDTSGWPTQYGYGMQLDVYDDDGDECLMGDVKLMYNNTWYNLQQCIDLGYIEPMVLIAATANVNLSGLLNGGYHSVGTWSDDPWMGRGCMMWFTKAEHLPQKVHAKGYSENSFFKAWSSYDKSVSLTPKSTPKVTPPTPVTYVYNGQARVMAGAGSTTGGTLQYSLDNSNWSTSIPTATNVNTYPIYYRVVGNNSYYDVPADYITSYITPADNPVKFDDQSAWVYFKDVDQNAPTISPSTGGQGTVTYSIVSQKDSANNTVNHVSLINTSGPQLRIDANTPVGVYKITMRASATGNQNYKAGSDDMVYTLEVKASSVPELYIAYYRGNPGMAQTVKGQYSNTNVANAKQLDQPFLIDIHAQDLPVETEQYIAGLTKLEYQISTDGGNSYGEPKVLYNGAATREPLEYHDLKVGETPGVYYIKITGYNAIGNAGTLQDIYRIGSDPSIVGRDQIYIVDASVHITRIKNYASAYDPREGDISSSIVVDYILHEDGTQETSFDSEWRLDTSRVTSYVVQYSITNSEGKVAKTLANINIVPKDSNYEHTNSYSIYDRFIDTDFISTLEHQSIWKSYDEYVTALDDALTQDSSDEIDNCVINSQGEIECTHAEVD